jgi:hypothetical protein
MYADSIEGKYVQTFCIYSEYINSSKERFHLFFLYQANVSDLHNFYTTIRAIFLEQQPVKTITSNSNRSFSFIKNKNQYNGFYFTLISYYLKRS